MARHFPQAVDAIVEMVNNKHHKDHFSACKLIVETLVRDETRTMQKAMQSGQITVKIEMAEPAKLVNEILGEAREETEGNGGDNQEPRRLESAIR